MSYSPHTGSYGYKAIAYLREHGLAASAVLADAIGCDMDSISAILAPALNAGAVKRERVNGITQWSLSDGVPLVREKDIVLDKPTDTGPTPPQIPSVWALGSMAGASTAPPKKSHDSIDDLLVAAGLASDPKPTLRCGAFTDGEVIIERGGQRMVLNEAEAEQFRNFLNRLAKATE